MKMDSEVFGEGSWVYCEDHARPHTTGWCTVCASKKTPLNATNRDEAYTEVRKLGLPIFGETLV
jgi:hypothetical protein